MRSNICCAYCGRFLVLAKTGRPRLTCSVRCRKAVQRVRVARALADGPVAAASEASGDGAAYPVFSS